MWIKKTIENPVKSPLWNVILIPAVVSILFYLLYSIVILYVLNLSFKEKPILPAIGVLLSVIVCLILFRFYLKRTHLGSDEWYNGLTSYTAYRTSLAGEILIFFFILYDYSVHDRIQWAIIGILIAMALTEVISMLVYTIKK